MISEIVQAVGLGLVLMLPLANPLTTVVLFISLSGAFTVKERNLLALKTSFYVFCIMIVAFYAGQAVMDTFGISLPGLRMAGGMIVSYIGFRMLFPATQLKTRPDDDSPQHDFSFVPLAMPSTAGPGTIAMIISSVSTIRANALGFSPLTLMIAPPVTFLIISTIVWICLRSSGGVIRILGKSGIDAISRLMGFLLICMGIQFIINGVMDLATN
ncbi:MarC family NAAT transporter [Citrobacter koseri]|uniref:MarC family NAAT transporter n=1 Tax=Citrobacter koseri TaxID=545 RepID=UPI0029420638|nr:MarC family NAAT transporter [Citrobacter koseri]MEB2704036.1 MarC family NAAT transporter [Citrobacter koseri]MEB2709583.1 MarC family NAAT transporter [Citrobacter koseri]WOJ30420.1 MarC family NAAT transporter [Citrobacter koseri]WOJ34594.1 MarC family NAAT transporter [Citrobacter koseri]